MTYHDAVVTVTADLDDDTDVGGQAVGAGVRLALVAWRHLGAADGRWDRFGLEVLAMLELLPDLTDVAVVCDPPDIDDPAMLGALRTLLLATARRMDGMAADPGLEVARRLSWEAAAIGLRRAVEVLP